MLFRSFFALTEKETRDLNQIRLEVGQPIRFGVDDERGVAMRSDGRLEIVDVATVGIDALLVHDPGRDDPGLAFSLANLSTDPTGPTPIGVFRDVQRPVYGRNGRSGSDHTATDEELAELLVSGDTWTIA